MVFTPGIAAMQAAPRCGAWGRQKQRPCRRPAERGRTRCYLHGGRNPGAPPGNKHSLKHGAYAADTIETRRTLKTALTAVSRQADELAAEANPKRPRGRPRKAATPQQALQEAAGAFSRPATAGERTTENPLHGHLEGVRRPPDGS